MNSETLHNVTIRRKVVVQANTSCEHVKMIAETLYSVSIAYAERYPGFVSVISVAPATNGWVF